MSPKPVIDKSGETVEREQFVSKQTKLPRNHKSPNNPTSESSRKPNWINAS